MMYNIKTGRGEVKQRSNDEIIILASSLHKLAEEGTSFVYTDRHAYLHAAQYSSDLDELEMIDWVILQRRDFKRDADDPEKFERYQAEALVHRSMATDSLMGVGCYNRRVQTGLQKQIDDKGIRMKVVVQPSWYF